MRHTRLGIFGGAGVVSSAVIALTFVSGCVQHRPSSWPARTATPIQVGLVTPFSSSELEVGCGPPCPSNPLACNANGLVALSPCVPIGRCVNVPDETCAAATGAAPHFCWWSIPEASDYTVIVEEVGPPRRTVWAWTMHFESATATRIGAEYGNSCGQLASEPIPLVPGRAYEWGVAARVDTQLFALGGPWRFTP